MTTPKLALRLILGALGALLGLFLGVGRGLAAPEGTSAVRADVAIPDALRPWVGWALRQHEEELCPFLHGGKDDGQCAWPGTLTLSLGDKGGAFSQRWRTYTKTWVALPGDKAEWPQSVKVDGKAAVVIDGSEEEGSTPRVWLTPGEHVVSGTLGWDEAPEALAVPPETALVALTLRGKKVPQPEIDKDGKVWLQRESHAVEEDVLETSVYRRVVDDIPLQLTTRIDLRVSGKGREVLLGHALPAGFVPMALESPLPARMEPDGRLRVQVRAGTFTIELRARREGVAQTIERPDPEGPWAAEEVWVFESKPALRQVSVEGVPAIDPQQTTLPADWKKLPTYAIKVGEALKLVEQRRGDVGESADQLSIARELWLAFDGSGYLVRDRIGGTLRAEWRLEAGPNTEVGRVAVDGRDQFITVSPGTEGSPTKGRRGVELRQSQIALEADSRIPGPTDRLRAVGWEADFQHVQASLHLPPGWRLLHVFGADRARGTWLEAWTLLDLFIVLLVAFATGHLFGRGWGIVVAIALLLVTHEAGAPFWIWPVVLAFEALTRLVKSGRLRPLLRFVHLGSRVILALVCVTFAVHTIRAGLYPSLELDGRGGAGFDDTGGETRFGSFAVKGEPAPAATNAPTAADSQSEADISEVAGKESGAKIASILASRTQERIGNGSKWKKAQLTEYDARTVVQTGLGLPSWQWRQIPLEFNGPVARTQELRLILTSPLENFVLAILRVLLLAAIALRLLAVPAQLLPPQLRRWGAAAVATFLVLCMGGGEARAEMPQPELLKELTTRLTERPTCHPNCASISRVELDVSARALTMRLEIGAAAATAVPLPGSAKHWLPERVLLDGKPAAGLKRDADGKLWIALGDGTHQVIVDGLLPERASVQIALPLVPHHLAARVSGWRLDGLHENGQADGVLQLTRVAERGEASTLRAEALPAFVRVDRAIELGLKWTVDTTVTRLTPLGSAVVIEVPLLAGESVTTPGVRVQKGKALVNLGPSQQEFAWSSLLEQQAHLGLVAPEAVPWVESWAVSAGPLWHFDAKGPPMVARAEQGHLRPRWQPWPGEQLMLAMTRPEGAPGQTLTIDRSTLSYEPGSRATDVSLTLDIRSSRGGQHQLTLPEDAVLKEVKIGGAVQPIRAEKRTLVLPIVPGAQHIELSWREPTSVGTYYRTSAVDIGTSSVNAQVHIAPGADRWVLWCRGPLLGPAVLFYSHVAIFLLVALLLGRLSASPLATHHWFFLLLGLTQVPVWAAALVPSWLLLLRQRKLTPVEGRRAFNLRQVLLVLASGVAFIVLTVSITCGLLGVPEMQIEGNGSGAFQLHWFADRSLAALPRPQMISVPMWCYRVVMLTWALWLASSMIRWLKWGWASFSDGGLWRQGPPKRLAKIVTTPPTPPTAPRGISDE